MTTDARKVSELAISTTLSSNDRVVVVANTTGNVQTKTITLANFSNSVILPIANSTKSGIVKVGDGIFVDSNGTISVQSAIPNTNADYVGYILTTNSVGGADWERFTGINEVISIVSSGKTSYTLTEKEAVILVNPAIVGHDVTITLPIATAIEGKEILIKLIDASTGHKVIVTTDDLGNAYLENPLTGSFVNSYELRDSGQAETWIHDGSVYRHLNTARATPVFYTNANTYAQVVVKNASAGNNASSDLALYNNLGDEAAGAGPFIDIGIDGSNYSNSNYTLYGPSDGYVYVDNNGNPGGNLIIGTAGDRSIVFHANGTNTDKKVLTVNSTSITLAKVLQAPQTTKQNNSTGTAGQICWDGSYIYVCTATNVWKRATLNTF
jgi:hypothetical protein